MTDQVKVPAPGDELPVAPTDPPIELEPEPETPAHADADDDGSTQEDIEP